MKILVTGGAGFIGSHVCERLLKDGHRICVIDNMSNSHSPDVKQKNLDAIGVTEPFTSYKDNICDGERVREIFKRERPEVTVHLAARAGVRPSVEDPLVYEETNVRGTLVVLEACREFGVKQVVFFSSSSVYGTSETRPFREDDPLMPISPYAATKLVGEQFCRIYSHLHSLSSICLRCFSVYGPRQRPDLALRKFTQLIIENRPITVFGDGLSSRDYTYIDDVVDVVSKVIRYDCRFEVFNVGSGHPVRLDQLIRTIEQTLGREARVVWRPTQSADVPITWADISKATALLGYSPKTSLAEGIRKYLDWRLGSVSNTDARRTGVKPSAPLGSPRVQSGKA